VIGGGAREHAVVARLASDRDVGELVCAPGNPGIARIARTIPCDISNPDAVLDLALREQIDFTVVGPELPLSVGIADRFATANRLLFGPAAGAARLESSKAFAPSAHSKRLINSDIHSLVKQTLSLMFVSSCDAMEWKIT